MIMDLFFLPVFIKTGVDRVEIFAVQLLLRDAEGIGDTVNMKYIKTKSSLPHSVDCKIALPIRARFQSHP